MAIGLDALGISVKTYSDGICIEGGSFQGGLIDSFGDHRIAMAFVIAGLRASKPIKISNCANVGTSFPGFIDLANEVGIPVKEVTEKH
jgi:3-phosphoshikimate 1-carboxyvinyltransferase